MAALAHGDELVGRNDLPAAGVQFVEVVNLQPNAGRAAALAAPSCSIENSGAKPLPRPSSLPRVRGAEGATRPRRASAADDSADGQRASHTASMAGGMQTLAIEGGTGPRSPRRKPAGESRCGHGDRGEWRPAPRPHRLSIKLTDHEYEELEARAAAEGTTKAAIVRAAIASARARGAGADLTHDQALALLSDAAISGSVVAMVALERALRLLPPPAELPGVEQPVENELARWRRRHEVGR